MLKDQILEHIPDNVRKAIESSDWQPTEIETTYQCETCQDLHMIRYSVPIDHPKFGKLFPCPDCEGGRALEDRRIQTKLSETKLPKGYQNLTFETWDELSQEEKRGKGLALNSAKLFVQAESHYVSLAEAYRLCGRDLDATDAVRNSLIFQGVPGLGKTGLAAAIVNALMAQNKQVLYIRTQDFIEALKQSFDRDKRSNDGEDKTQAIIDTVKQHPRLVLDEFNMSAVNEWRQEQIENIVRYRYGNALPTIFTCNATEDELERQWGIRTTSVLFTMAHWIPMGGVGLRDLRQNLEAF